MKEYYTVAETAALLEKTPATIRNYINQGKLEGVIEKAKYLIPSEQILELVNSEGKKNDF